MANKSWRIATTPLGRLFFYPPEEWAAAFRDRTVRRLIHACLAVGLAAAGYGVLSGLTPPVANLWMPAMLGMAVGSLSLAVLRWGLPVIAFGAAAVSVTFAIAVTVSTVAVLFCLPAPIYAGVGAVPGYMGTFVQWTPVFFVLNAMWFRPAGARMVNLATAFGVLAPCALWLATSGVVRVGSFDTDAVAMNFFVLGAGLLAQEIAFAVRELRASRLSAARQALLDLRRRRVMERELRDARADIARLNRLSIINATASTVAHEVRQPLTAVTNFAQAAGRWLARTPPDLPRAQAALAGLESEAIRARDVIEEIRALTSRPDTTSAEIDVEALLRQTAALIRREASARGVRVEIQAEPGLGRIPGRPVQLQQVLLNLAVNSLEAFGGTQGPVLWLAASAHLAGGVTIVVADNGPGIAPGDMGRVLRGLFSTKPGGSGLGLIICRQIVEDHGGMFDLGSTSAGVTATLTLPAARRAERSA